MFSSPIIVQCKPGILYSECYQQYFHILIGIWGMSGYPVNKLSGPVNFNRIYNSKFTGCPVTSTVRILCQIIIWGWTGYPLNTLSGLANFHRISLYEISEDIRPTDIRYCSGQNLPNCNVGWDRISGKMTFRSGQFSLDFMLKNHRISGNRSFIRLVSSRLSFRV